MLQASEIQRLFALLQKMAAFADSEQVVVTFPDPADTDLQIPHALRSTNPEEIGYVVEQADRACRVYQDTSATRLAWSAGLIILRCDTAGAKVRLLLTVPKTSPETIL
jgi:hypothetical protein